MGKAHFITATGTDSGKTFVAEGLARALRAQGRTVRALKPVMSGYDETAIADSDAGRLLAACGLHVTKQNVAAISPWRLGAPLSPDRAAAREGRSIDFDALVGWCRAECVLNDDAVLIEGVGGVMVPLDDRHTVRDWIAALGLPTLLVVGTYLGAISHALTALSALREAGVRPALIVINESAAGIGIDDTLASLVPHIGGAETFALRRDDADGLSALASRLLAETA